MLRFATFAFVAISALAGCSAQQLPLDSNGNVDIDSIRRQVMSGMPLPPSFAGTDNVLHSFSPPVARSTDTWGIRLMPVPSLFSDAHPLLADSVGLLVVDVANGSPAQRAGIEQGMVILAVDGQTLRNIEDVPSAVDGAAVKLLTEDGVRTVRLRTVASPTSVSSSSNAESVSVSNTNGQIRLQASLMTRDGLKQIDLQGNRAAIDRQIGELPADVADHLRSRVSY